MSTQVYLDICIDQESIGRVVCELYDERAHRTVQNFKHLCMGDCTGLDKKPLTYKGNAFHRVIKNFMVQCGDIVNNPNSNEILGSGGCSIYATNTELEIAKDPPCYGNFEDENLGEFTEPFILAMANQGTPNTNNSQFFITTIPAPHLNGKHSIFGKVIAGKSVIRTIEKVEVDEEGLPKSGLVYIKDCGIFEQGMPIPLYNASNSTIGDDFYEEYPDDDQRFDSEDFDSAFNAANTIKESGNLLYKSRDFQNALYKYRKAHRYVAEYLPEADVDAENNKKFIDLKYKLYLNMALMCFYLKMFHESMKYTNYVIESSEASTDDVSKAHFRRGNAYLSISNIDDALADYRFCHEYDPSNQQYLERLEYTQKLIDSKCETTKRNLAKFFA